MKKILLGLVILCMFAGSAFAQTVTILKRENWGGSRVVYGYIEFSGSYTTGGITLSARSLGLDNLKEIVVADLSSPAYGWKYDYDTNKILLYYTENNIYEPTGAAADVFIVNDDNGAASNGKLVCVSAFGGAPGGHLMYLDSAGGSSADLRVAVVSASDSTTTMVLSDSLSSPAGERGDSGIIGGDTLFFDDDATNAYEALFYTGDGLGDMGDIRIPFGRGSYIKVLHKTRSQIHVANALPLYYVEASHIANKFESVTNGNADGTFECERDYTSLVLYNPWSHEQVGTGTSFIASVRFIAIGN